MDELLMVLPAGLVAVPIFALVQRAYGHLASASLWAGAWCVLFVTTIVGAPGRDSAVARPADIGLLPKPFGPEKLVRSVAQALEEFPPGPAHS